MFSDLNFAQCRQDFLLRGIRAGKIPPMAPRKIAKELRSAMIDGVTRN